MKSKLFLACLLINSFGHVLAQEQFKDVLVINDTIFGLTEDGSIAVFSSHDGSKINRQFKPNSRISAFTLDHNGSLVVLQGSNAIQRLTNSKWQAVGKAPKGTAGILFNSQNNCFGIGESGITEISNNESHFSAKSLNDQITYKGKWSTPSCFMMDRNDIIWVGFGHGEWGGNMFVFDTRQLQFIDLKLDSFRIELLPIKSFCEDSLHVYVSSGLQHMINWGCIAEFNDYKARVLFKSESDPGKPDPTSARYLVPGHYIGPMGYNAFNSSLYFYSQYGIFKAEVTKDLSKIENWELVVKPKLTWQNGQPDAVGSPMNVSKLAFIDRDRFVFVSQNNGIGLFDGKKLKMLH